MAQETFEVDGWSISLVVFTGFDSQVPATGVIVGSGGDARWVAGAMEIKDALQEKANKYGELGLPYIIVVTDCKDEIIGNGRDELTNALLGDEVVEGQLSASGTVRPYLIKQGGFWFKGKKPVRTNVSAVILFPTVGIWHLREADWAPIMALNPWAEHPLDPAVLPLPHFAARDDKWTFVPGVSAADNLGLPAEWPPRMA